MRKYSYPCPTDYGRCQCGYSRKLDAFVSNDCKLHPDVPTSAQVKETRRIALEVALHLNKADSNTAST